MLRKKHYVVFGLIVGLVIIGQNHNGAYFFNSVFQNFMNTQEASTQQSDVQNFVSDVRFLIRSHVAVLAAVSTKPNEELIFRDSGKVITSQVMLAYKVVFINKTEVSEENVNLETTIPLGSDLVVDSIFMQKKGQKKIRLQEEEAVVDGANRSISALIANFDPGESITILYRVVVKKDSGPVVQNADLIKADGTRINSQALVNIILPRNDVNVLSQGGAGCFSKQYLKSLLDQTALAETLQKLFPELSESVEYFLGHRTDESVYLAMQNAILSFVCVQIPANFLSTTEQQMTQQTSQVAPSNFYQMLGVSQEVSTQELTQEVIQETVPIFTQQELPQDPLPPPQQEVIQPLDSNTSPLEALPLTP